VRIFLGTEDAQFRAERVFCYAIERVRDPGRTYEIVLMKNLPGFERAGWRTGFTNYRFAVPALAGARGRAIYNDVDQIYLADPAELFDLDMGDHGYLAISPDETSVMLIDCERMAGPWTLAEARRRRKKALVARAAGVPGVWGALDPAWNVRDTERLDLSPRLLHYTALHLQPWQPHPHVYTYHDHPWGDRWRCLEAAADAEGYEVFTCERPSARFWPAIEATRARGTAASAAGQRRAGPRPALEAPDVDSVLHCSLAPDPEGAPAVPAASSVERFEVAGERAWPKTVCDAVVASDLLEHVPPDDVPWLLAELFARASRFVTLVVGDAGQDRRPADWWHARVAAAGARHPAVAWRLDVIGGGSVRGLRAATFRSASRRPPVQAPHVWVLRGQRAGDNAQLICLAEALGWRFDVKDLIYNWRYRWPNVVLGSSLVSLDRARSSPLGPPWPDLILASGRRSVPVARWIRRRSRRRTRLVHLGRPWAPLAWFDLVVTTAQYGLPVRANVLHNTLPLIATATDRDAAAVRQWTTRLAHLPRPWTAVLIGGSSRPYVLDVDTGRRLGEQASAVARTLGGSLLVTVGRRTSAEAAAALCASITAPAHCHRFTGDPTDNPYVAYLALADRFLVTADSASMLADACATGRAVSVLALPTRPDWRLRVTALVRGWIGDRHARRSRRGTPQQQGWAERVWDRLVDLGLVTSTRNLDDYHRVLEARGLVTRPGAPAPTWRHAHDDLRRSVERIQALMAGAAAGTGG
jgi:mitochondrial fission protein ELM1